MKLIKIFGFLLLLTCTADSSLLDPVIENVRHIKVTHPPEKVSGMWKKKMMWKPRWIKEWKSSNVLKPVWKKFWGPVIIREWVPIPKPPPQWDGVHSVPADHHSTPPETPFFDVGKPPVPNFSYLQKSPHSGSYASPKPVHHGSNVRGGPFTTAQTNYVVPHLPITSGYNTQAEKYSGQSSYGTNMDNGAYDLNPPVEHFNPDYSYRSPFENHEAHHAPLSINSVKPAVPPSHIHHPTPTNHGPHPYHHHHHHHPHVKSSGHIHPSHSADLTKFPPDWNSWESTHPKTHPHSSGLAQASSAVSIVSESQSTTPKPHEAVGDHLHSQGLLPADNEFIQQAALVSEYHYTEHALENPTSAPPLSPPLRSSFIQHPVLPSGFNQSRLGSPSHSTDSHHVVFPGPTTVQPSRPPVSPSNTTPVPAHAPVPYVPPKPLSSSVSAQTHSVQLQPSASPPSHKPQFTSPLVSHKIPPQTPTSAPPVRQIPNNAKIPPSASFHSLLPVAPHRPVPVQTHPPVPTRAHTLHPDSPHGLAPAHVINSATVHSQATPHAPPNRQNTVHPRKPGGRFSTHTPSDPLRHPNTPPPKKTAASKPESTKDRKVHENKKEMLKVPDFKALPTTSVEAFHFIEGFPSNDTLTRAALIGNLNHTGSEENKVEIISVKPHQKQIPPYVAKLAQAIVSEHLKKVENTENSTVTEQTTSEAPTDRATVTIVYPSTNPFVRKTLKAYLAEETSAEKSTKVFVVTPVPQEKLEDFRNVSNGV